MAKRRADRGQVVDHRPVAVGRPGKSLLIVCAALASVVFWARLGVSPTAWAASWSIQQNPAVQAGESVALHGVSCPSPSFCVAVGDVGNSEGFAGSGSVIELWNGSQWSIQQDPGPTGSQLFDVSCSSSSACMAVGQIGFQNPPYGAPAGAPLAEFWNGSQWSIEQVPTPPLPLWFGLNSVSCSSSTACIAVGGTSGGRLLTEQWNGLIWSIVPLGTRGYLGGLSCPSATDCTATFSTQGQGPEKVPHLARWNGRDWAFGRILNLRPHGTAPAIGLSDVSCTSVTACTTVGSYVVCRACSPVTFAEHWNGRRWSVQRTLNPSKYRGLIGVSCGSNTACLAVGYESSRENGPELPLAEQWNGHNWSTLPTARGLPPFAFGSQGFSDISCSSNTACTAVGWYVRVPGGQPEPFIERYS